MVGRGESLSGSDSESDSSCSAPLWLIPVMPLELGEKDLQREERVTQVFQFLMKFKSADNFAHLPQPTTRVTVIVMEQ